MKDAGGLDMSQDCTGIKDKPVANGLWEQYQDWYINAIDKQASQEKQTAPKEEKVWRVFYKPSANPTQNHKDSS